MQAPAPTPHAEGGGSQGGRVAVVHSVTRQAIQAALSCTKPVLKSTSYVMAFKCTPNCKDKGFIKV